LGKLKRPLADAARIAAAMLDDLAPVCTRIAVAGSVRREKGMVGDIELVAIARLEPAGLFGDHTSNCLWRHLHESDAYRFTKGDNPDGRYYQLALRGQGDLQVDLFLAQPDNWGLTLLVRTGSAEFSTAILARWKRVQGIGYEQPGSVDGRLVTRDGRIVPTPDEETIFRMLGLPVIAPGLRQDAAHVR
jgi:DNA polymerase/3'-5' exonuclease PolX